MEQLELLSEKEVIEIIKKNFSTNKVNIYKRKRTAPFIYDIVVIAIMDNKLYDIQKELSNFFKSEYELRNIINFDNSEALIENDFKVHYLFFNAKIYIKG